jgi:hypothetical protein
MYLPSAGSEQMPYPHPSLEVAGDFITQVSEPYPGGKQSCALTVQLNALVALGTIDGATALSAQEEIVSSGDYAHYWGQQPNGQLHWRGSTSQLPAILKRQMQAPVQTTKIHRPVNETCIAVEQELRKGKVALLAGRSLVGNHARLAFEPSELAGQGMFYLHDPKYSDTTGLYRYVDLPKSQTREFAETYQIRNQG